MARPIFPAAIDAVIFDMDGTLLDTEAVHLQAFRETGPAIGWDVPDTVLLAMVGIHRDANALMLARALGPDFPVQQFHAESDIRFDAAVRAGVPLRPGALAMLDYLANRGTPMAIATSTAAPAAQQRLKASGLLPYFDTVVTRSDVTCPKPHPEPYRLATQRLGVDPARALAVEDSHAGVRSASAAGIATVMVPDLLPATPDLAALCVAVLPSLTQLFDILQTG